MKKFKIREYIKKYASDPELLTRAAKQIQETIEEEKKSEEAKDNESELSETSFKSDDE